MNDNRLSVLFTGASGFLGSQIRPLLEANYYVDTLGRGNSDSIQCDLSTQIPFFESKFDIVLHTAGKAHCEPKSENDRQSFFATNVEGTKHLCQGIENALPTLFIFVSSVAVYGLQEGSDITEETPLLGISAYAQSKIQAEAFLTDWCQEHHVTLAILRPSLLAGRNPVGNLGVMVRGIRSGLYASVHHGMARRSILMAEDIARLVPLIVQYGGGVFNVCDTEAPSFRELERLISNQLHVRMPLSIPDWLAKLVLSPQRYAKMSQSLTFSNQKARDVLHWEPLPIREHFII